MEKPSTAIKLIAIDIDGTLLTPTGQITLRTRAAIEEARRAGIIVTLATARRYIGTMAVAAELGIELPLIVYDGAMVVSHPSRAILVSRTLSSDTARRAIEIFQRSHVQPVIHPCENGSCLKEEVWTGPAEYDNAGVATYLTAALNRTRRMSYEELSSSSVNALRAVAFAEEELLRPMLPAFSALDCSVNFVTRGGYGSAELAVLPAGCSKASGVAALAAHYGLAMEEVMALGDNYNDLEMLRGAGWGVAMGQAPEPVKAAAKAVTTTNLEDGVALAIERYALDGRPRETLASLIDQGAAMAALTSFDVLP
jgi:Cof subfamily protein (haloacid dehalogenase superfamily)